MNTFVEKMHTPEMDRLHDEALEIEEGARHPQGWPAYLIALVALAWSLFQMALPSVLSLTADHIRSIHLAFAIVLAFLCYPTLKKQPTNRFLKFLAVRDRLTFLDYLLAGVACFCVLYLSIDYLGISQRQGAPIVRDIVIGVALMVFLLEAARRTLGPALSVVALFFTAYAFWGPYMPEIIAFKGVSINRFFGQITMSTEGIYGVPLDVSANIVFLFVLFGALLEKAGGGEYFVQISFGLLGRFRGGPAKAAVCASALTGMISGSSIANTVTTGTFTIPLMKKTGYPPEKAAAVEVASSTNGQLTPPIMGAAAFIIAEYTNLEYFEVIKAAIIPALVSYIGLIYITHLTALKLGLKGIPKEELPSVWSTFKHGIHYIIPLGVLVFELMVLRHSPELGAFRAIIMLMVIMLLQQPVKALLNIEHHGQKALPGWQGIKAGGNEILDGMITGAKNMVGIGIATATAGVIVGVVTMGLGGLINEIVEWLSGGNIMLLLFITAIASLILGMGLPTTANYIVMASLTAPIIVVVGGDNGLVVPLIAAHLFVFYFGILADDTPPVGLAAYAASAIAKSDPIKTGLQGFLLDIRTAILPFIFIFNTEVLLIGIEGWGHGLFIFSMCILGMFAFGAATQNFMIVKNKPWETLFFLIITLMFMRPQFFSQTFDQWFPVNERVVTINTIQQQMEPILQNFDEQSEDLINVIPQIQTLISQLEPLDQIELKESLNLPELTVEAFQEKLTQWDFERKDAQSMLNQFLKHGTEPYLFYIIACFGYLTLFLSQRHRFQKGVV